MRTHAVLVLLLASSLPGAVAIGCSQSSAHPGVSGDCTASFGCPPVAQRPGSGSGGGTVVDGGDGGGGGGEGGAGSDAAGQDAASNDATTTDAADAADDGAAD